jgi:hypothetical protein
MWLRDYIPSAAPTARILTYGYNSRIRGKQSATILGDLAKSFLNNLVNIRNETEVS